MPAWTPFGVKSSSSDASWLGRSEPDVPPQPASSAHATSKIDVSRIDMSWRRSMFGVTYGARRGGPHVRCHDQCRACHAREGDGAPAGNDRSLRG